MPGRMRATTNSLHMESGDKLLGIAAALGSAASWAVGAILFKRLGEQMSSFGMTLAKGAVSVILLGIAVWATGFESMDSHTVMLMVLSGVVGIALGDTFFFQALKDLSPVSMIVLMVVGQVLTILLALIFLQEMPSAMEWIGISCILAGVGITLSADLTGERSPSGWRGVMFGLASVVCMSVSVIIAKVPLDHMSSIQATFARMGSGTLGVFLVGMLSGQVGGWLAPLKNRAFLANFLLAVCVVTFGGFWLSMFAIKHLDVAVANTLNSTEPIFVIPLAYFVLKEKINTRSVIGAISVVAGVALIFLNSPTQPTN
jgi:drug/metabolite transporter (DMT)-like permease